MFDLIKILIATILTIVVYTVYQRTLHPLSVFPGPFIASLTNFWRFYHELRGDLPSAIDKYHNQYGPFIRVSPDEVNTNVAEVIDVVYKKGGRHYLKSAFYDGFTAIRPNIFGTRDENLHGLRRRQMAHAFSQASLVKMEYIFDRHVRNLIRRLDQKAASRKAFHLEEVLRFYSQDANGDLSLGVQFGTQNADDPALLPPLNDHIALAKLTGYVPWIKPTFDKYGSMIPWPYLRKLLRSRAWMRQEAARVTDLEFVRTGRNDGKAAENLTEDPEPGRINLFSSLVRARDPDTGEYIERDDITSNAITFLTAGSHSTAATLEIFFWYFLHYPQMLQRAVAEISDSFGQPDSDDDIIPFPGLESRLPYLSAFFLECYRLSPTFQHPAPRIAPRESTSPRYPTVISGTTIPPGYAISASVLSLHRNKTIWGEDAEQFIPERWFNKDTKENERLLMHFGAGHRACIGRNQSLIMLWKAMVEVIRRFDFVLANEGDKKQKKIDLIVRGFAELAEPLSVTVTRRTTGQ
ncbi:MAG: hypothetical protein Q9227_000638 [Pyrenula ochraceoflavens]